jgi:outer membrane lipoprotein-sorting protein
MTPVRGNPALDAHGTALVGTGQKVIGAFLCAWAGVPGGHPWLKAGFVCVTGQPGDEGAERAHDGAMSIFDRRPGLRWAVPAGAAVLLVGGAALAPMAAIADSGLEPRTAEELLVALAQRNPTPVSGTVATSADLGLPGLPMGMGPASGPMALASGEGTLRVWTDGPDRQRLALIERAAERLVVRNGQQVWSWSSAEATVDKYVLPARDDEPAAPQLPPGIELPSTPQEAAALALEAIEPSTEVTTSGVGTVAGRDAYELVLTPKDPETLVARVTLSMDAETDVPLRVRVYSTANPDPAFEVGFSTVDYSTPDASLFEFTPPPGATVTEHAAADMDAAEAPGGAGADRPEGAEPTVVGKGWSTIVITELPVDSLADLAEDGMRASADQGYSRGGDPAATALALIEALPAESGAWGTGRVLRGTLFSVILTDDGRIAVGAVSPEALGAALAAQ